MYYTQYYYIIIIVVVLCPGNCPCKHGPNFDFWRRTITLIGGCWGKFCIADVLQQLLTQGGDPRKLIHGIRDTVCTHV